MIAAFVSYSSLFFALRFFFKEKMLAKNVQFLKLPTVIRMVSKSRSSIYQAVQKGEFPAPIKIGPRAVAWTSSSIEEWQQSCVNTPKAS